MHKLYKPDGKEVTVNDNSLEYALSIGWTKKPAVRKVKSPPKQGSIKRTVIKKAVAKTKKAK